MKIDKQIFKFSIYFKTKNRRKKRPRHLALKEASNLYVDVLLMTIQIHVHLVPPSPICLIFVAFHLK